MNTALGKDDGLKANTFRHCLTAVVAAVALATTLSACANPTDADPFGVGPYRPCEEKVKTSLSEAVDSLNELDGRIRPVPPDKAAFFAREEPHVFEARDPQRMGALFGDPYYSLWAFHNRVRELAGQVRRFADAQQGSLSATEELRHTSRLLFDFTATMSALTLVATERAREGGPDTPNILTDEQLDVYQENLEGIAMYVSEYGRCRATLEARQKAEAAKR